MPVLPSTAHQLNIQLFSGIVIIRCTRGTEAKVFGGFASGGRLRGRAFKKETIVPSALRDALPAGEPGIDGLRRDDTGCCRRDVIGYAAGRTVFGGGIEDRFETLGTLAHHFRPAQYAIGEMFGGMREIRARRADRVSVAGHFLFRHSFRRCGHMKPN